LSSGAESMSMIFAAVAESAEDLDYKIGLWAAA
jgi:hypothetical protein